MDGATLAVLGTFLAAVVVALFTRRSARDDVGLRALTAAVTEGRLTLGEVRTELTALQVQVREHRVWDDQIYDQARQAGWDVSRPPPLG
jgi:hypothetical protein